MNKNVELKYCNPPKASERRPGRTDFEVLVEVFWNGDLMLEICKWTDVNDRPFLINTAWPLLAAHVGKTLGYPDITPAVADAPKAADEVEKFPHQKFCLPKANPIRRLKMESASSLDLINTRLLVNLVAKQLATMFGPLQGGPTPASPQEVETFVTNFMSDINAVLLNSKLGPLRYSVDCSKATSTYVVRGKRSKHYAGVHFDNKDRHTKTFRGSWRKVKRRIQKWIEQEKDLLLLNMTMQPKIPVDAVMFSYKV